MNKEWEELLRNAGASQASRPSEPANLPEFSEPEPEPPPVGADDVEMLAHVAALQNKSGNWLGTVLVLIVSLVMFVAAGVTEWQWDFVLLLVPVLLFHELGHYLAMRAFNYKNLKMFFIPFLGAAVSGRHYNVAGWKKSIVSLMGPVPGILLGAALGGAGVAYQQPWMIECGLLLEVLNVFNLLPVLPLDGGWNLHTLLFSRHAMLDLAFRLLAIVVLLALALQGAARFGFYIAGAMIFSLPTSFRLARMVDRLRRRDPLPASADGSSIPIASVLSLAQDIRASFPASLPNKTVAELVVKAFETLNTRPPGFFVTVCLLSVHLASMVGGLVVAVLLMLGQRGDLAEVLQLAAEKPTHSLRCGSIRETPAPIGAQAPWDATILATYSDAAAADQAFTQTSSRVPANFQLLLFGETLVLQTSNNDVEKQRDALESLGGTLETISSKEQIYARMQFLATSELKAAELANSIQEFLFSDVDGSPLISPWSDEWKKHPQRQRFQTARATLRRARALQLPFEEVMRQRIAAVKAKEEGDAKEADRIEKELSDKLQGIRKLHLDALRADRTVPVDEDVLDLEELIHAPGVELGKVVELKRRQRDLMGVSAQRPGEMDQEMLRRRVSGLAQQAGQVVDLHLSFFDPREVLPPLVRWICDQGGQDVHYDLQASRAEDPEDP